MTEETKKKLERALEMHEMFMRISHGDSNMGNHISGLEHVLHVLLKALLEDGTDGR